MSEFGGGRHSSPEGPFSPRTEGLGFGIPRYEPARYEVRPYVTGRIAPVGRDAGTAASRRAPGVMDRHADRTADETGPLAEPDWWSYGSSDHPDHPLSARHGGGSQGPAGWGADDDELPAGHPSAPLPPRPSGVWDRLQPRRHQDDIGDDAQTVAQPLVPGAPLDTTRGGGHTPGSVGGSRSADDDADSLGPDDQHPGVAVAVAAEPGKSTSSRRDARPPMRITTAWVRTPWSTTRRSARTSRSSRTTRAPAGPAGAVARSR
jgi:hypothetical protein